MRIPRLIHQTISDKTRLHPAIVENIERLTSLNGNWRYELYDDDDIREFIARHYGHRILAIFDGIHPVYGAARADLFRYLLMFERGGVYLDIKSGCASPLDSVIREDDVFLLSRRNNRPGKASRAGGPTRRTT